MKYFLITLLTFFILSHSKSQNVKDFEHPKFFKLLSSQDGTIEIPSKVEYNGESLLLYLNNKLSAVLTDLTFIREQITEGVKCKVYLGTDITDKEQNVILISENAQFIYFKQPKNSFVFLSNKGVTTTSNKDKAESQLRAIKASGPENIKQLTKAWDANIRNRNFNQLIDLYYGNLIYYGKRLKSSECINTKRNYIEKYPNFSQRIIGDIDVSYSENLSVSSFIKEVTLANGSIKKYDSRLFFVKENGEWKISVETDKTTDRNIIKHKKRPTDAIKGDFNGDGKIEYMWQAPPVDIPGTSFGVLYKEVTLFSDSKLPQINNNSDAGGYLLNLGDLNENGSDEIGYWKYGQTSCWRLFYVYTLVDNNWKLAIDPFPIHCDYWDEKGPVKKDPQNHGSVIISETESNGGFINLKNKSVRLNHMSN